MYVSPWSLHEDQKTSPSASVAQYREEFEPLEEESQEEGWVPGADTPFSQTSGFLQFM